MSKKFLMESTQGLNAKIQDRKLVDHMIRTGQPCPSHRIYGQPAKTFSLILSGISGKEHWLPSVFLATAPQGSFSVFPVPLLAMSLSHCHHPPPPFTGSTMMNIFITSQRLSGPHPTQTMTDLPKAAVQSNALEYSESHPRVREIPNPPPPEFSLCEGLLKGMPLLVSRGSVVMPRQALAEREESIPGLLHSSRGFSDLQGR